MKLLLVTALLWPSCALAQSAPVSTQQSPAVSAPPPHSGFGRPHECLRYYPGTALLAGEAGVTTLGFVIGTDGNVSDVRVLQSSGFNDLDEAALACARTWRYKPAMKTGAPVAVSWESRIVWVWDLDCRAFYRGSEPDFSAIDGTTQFDVAVQYGEVTKASILKSSGNPDLDAAAKKCIEKVLPNAWGASTAAKTAEGTMTVDWKKQFTTPPP
jgi:TonB family protein